MFKSKVSLIKCFITVRFLYDLSTVTVDGVVHQWSFGEFFFILSYKSGFYM